MKRMPSPLAIVSCLSIVTTAQLVAQSEEWTRPFPGHRVISNLYAVGTYGLGVFLLTTEEGHILINTGLEDSTPLIRENIEAVGFRLEDVKILLTMQAHWDHTAALAEINRSQAPRCWPLKMMLGSWKMVDSAMRISAAASRSNR